MGVEESKGSCGAGPDLTHTSQTTQQPQPPPRPRGGARRPGTAPPLNALANRLAAQIQSGLGCAMGTGARLKELPGCLPSAPWSLAGTLAPLEPEIRSKVSKTVEAIAELKGPDKCTFVHFQVFE